MVTKNKFYELHLVKYDLFKKQDPEIGYFDVVFEIEGKILYAHKTMLILVSPTFASMISDRWTPNRNESIKIKDYSYADFYQFITFLYSGECELTETNIFYSMVDIAEFYGVSLFKNYCEEYLSSMKITIGNIFPLMELAEKYSMIQFKVLVFDFVKINFQSIVDADEFLKLGKNDVKEIVISAKNEVEPEDLFQAVYKWTENQAMEKKAADPTINFNETIKAEISDFLPHIRFYEMELKFLHEFVVISVSHGFIFSHLELSKILIDRDRFFAGTIKITNERGQTLHGNVIPDKSVLRNIHSSSLLNCYVCSDKWCEWKTECRIPSTPSPLKKRNGVEWYLIYYNGGNVGVKRCSIIRDCNYLLAELTAGNDGFETAEGCKIEIE